MAEEAIPVRLKRIRLERGRTFGDVWLGWTLWRALCEPSSELHIAEDWYRRLRERREDIPILVARFGVSRETVRADLASLLEAGLLQRVGRGRSARYRALSVLP